MTREGRSRFGGENGWEEKKRKGGRVGLGREGAASGKEMGGKGNKRKGRESLTREGRSSPRGGNGWERKGRETTGKGGRGGLE